jgi:hypothetical protein
MKELDVVRLKDNVDDVRDILRLLMHLLEMRRPDCGREWSGLHGILRHCEELCDVEVDHE